MLNALEYFDTHHSQNANFHIIFVTFTDVETDDGIERMQSKWNVEKAALQAPPTVPEIEKKHDVSRLPHMVYSLYPWGRG